MAMAPRTSSAHVRLDFLSNDLDGVPDGPVVATFTNNYLIHANGNGIDVESIAAAPGALTQLTILGNTFQQLRE